MTTHVFVDESKRSDYLLAAAALSSTHARTARGLVRGLLLAGQRRVHMVKERPARQRTILSTLSASGARVVIYPVRHAAPVPTTTGAGGAWNASWPTTRAPTTRTS